MKKLASIMVLYLLAVTANGLPSYGSSGEARRIERLQMQELMGELFLMISAREGEFFEFSVAGLVDNNVACDLDGDRLTRDAILKIDGNKVADYYYAMLLSALTTGAKVELRYDSCLEQFGSSWPIVYAVVLSSPVS
jgi:hypothetical protein